VEQLPKNQTQAEADLPQLIRVSVGSAIVLGLIEGKLNAAPTTAYLMTYKPGKCTANCLFCPQARTSHSRAELLSRVSWPNFATKQVLQKIRKRLCRPANKTRMHPSPKLPRSPSSSYYFYRSPKTAGERSHFSFLPTSKRAEHKTFSGSWRRKNWYSHRRRNRRPVQ